MKNIFLSNTLVFLLTLSNTLTAQAQPFADGKLAYQLPKEWTQWYAKREEGFATVKNTLKQVNMLYADKNIKERTEFVKRVTFIDLEKDLPTPLQRKTNANKVTFFEAFFNEYVAVTNETFYKYIVSVPLNDNDIVYFIFADIAKGNLAQGGGATTLKQEVETFIQSLKYNY